MRHHMSKKRQTHRVVLTGVLLVVVFLGIWSIQFPNTEGVSLSAPSQVEASEQGTLPSVEPQKAAQRE